MTCERLIAQHPQITVQGGRYPEYLQKLVGRRDEQGREPGRLDLFLKNADARLMLYLPGEKYTGDGRTDAATA
jgi:hypothetical protein